jgi:DedD protein
MSRAKARPMATRPSRSDPVAIDPALPYKRRARRRLLGAVVMVSIVIAGLPFVLDPEPTLQRPEVVLDIPSRDTPLPTSGAVAGDKVAGATAGPTASAPPTAPAIGNPRHGGANGAAGSGSAVSPQPPQAAALDSRPGPPASPQGPGTGAARVQPAPPSAPTAPAPGVSRPPPPSQAALPAPPPVASPADRSPAAAASVTGRWVVQTGLFGRSENATALVVRIRGIGLPVYTESFEGPQGPRVRVRVGPFASRAEADEARARLSLNGIEATMVSL